MHRLTIVQHTFITDTQQYVGHPVAVIDIDGSGVQLVDGSGEMYCDMRVPDVAAGRSISAEDDPLRWAELMVDYISQGDLRATLEELASVEEPPSYTFFDADAAVLALHALVVPQR